jgi:hypothetical protein
MLALEPFTYMVLSQFPALSDTVKFRSECAKSQATTLEASSPVIVPQIFFLGASVLRAFWITQFSASSLTFLLAREEVKNFLPRVLAYCSTHGACGRTSAKPDDTESQKRTSCSETILK